MSAIMNARTDLTTERHRIAAVIILGALAAITLFHPGEALAQTPKAQAAAKAKASTPYQAYLAADCITGSNFCKFISEDVPAQSRLEIHRVACQGWHLSAMLPSFVVIVELRTSDNTFVGRIDFLETNYAPANGGSVWSISEPTLMFIPAGHKVQISLNSGSTGVGSYGCTISGFMAKAD
jgi:hypothetical protein